MLGAFVIDISIYFSIRNFKIGVNSVAVSLRRAGGYLNGVPRRNEDLEFIKNSRLGDKPLQAPMLHKPKLPT